MRAEIPSLVFCIDIGRQSLDQTKNTSRHQRYKDADYTLVVSNMSEIDPKHHINSKIMDDDLMQMSNEQLMTEIRKLRAGIREHRDSTGQELCWHHPKLWSLLPEKTNPKIQVPDWPTFMQGCVRYRQSLEE